MSMNTDLINGAVRLESRAANEVETAVIQAIAVTFHSLSNCFSLLRNANVRVCMLLRRALILSHWNNAAG
jgi:hypothetical protein